MIYYNGFKQIDWYKISSDIDPNGVFMYAHSILAKDEFSILGGKKLDSIHFTSLSVDANDQNKLIITKYWESSSLSFGNFAFNERISRKFPYLISIEKKNNNELEFKFNFRYGSFEFPYSLIMKVTKGQILLNYISTVNMYTFFDQDNNQYKWIQFCPGESNIIKDFPYLIVIDFNKDENKYTAIKTNKDRLTEQVIFESSSLLNGHFIPFKYKNDHLEVSYCIDSPGYLVYTEIKFNDKYIDSYEHEHIAYTPIYINNGHFNINHESGITIRDNPAYYCMDTIKICSPEQLI